LETAAHSLSAIAQNDTFATDRLGRRARGGGGGGQRALEGLGVRGREGVRQDTRPVALPSTISCTPSSCSPTAARPQLHAQQLKAQ